MNRDLARELCDSAVLVAKIKNNKSYAQNVYAALCNMRWQPADVWPVLNDEFWSCSWRASGGIVASIRGNHEDYLDYYCSGIGDETPDTGKWIDRPGTFVAEGHVTDEIRQDFAVLGWHPVPYDKD